MAVVLDTDCLAKEDRVEAAISAMRATATSSYVAPENPNEMFTARIDVWTFGTARIFRSEMSGIHLVRTAQQVRACPSPSLALAVQEAGSGLFAQGDKQQFRHVGQLDITDENLPYEFSWAGLGASRCLFVPLNELGLPRDLVREASTRLRASPLYDLVVDHIVGLTRNADALSADPTAASLGSISIELARALLASATTYDTHYRREALAATMLTQIRVYIREHITDVDLTPQRIAEAHNISVRQLYKHCAAADFSIHQWLVSQRLQGARDELVRTSSQRQSIAMVARRWGFASSTHFGRRFRAVYGMTPRDWRHGVTRDDMAVELENDT